MKMHPPGLLFFCLAAWIIATAEGQRQKLKAKQCNVKTMFTLATPCTSCVVAPRVVCPKGWIRMTQGLGERGCRYTVKLGEGILSLPGCSHMCKKEIEEKKCCQGFWGTECYECPSGSEKPCSGRGTCLDGIARNGTCICEGPYDGFACQDCLDENLFGPDCQSVCDCQHGVCNHGSAGDGSCTCHGGYTGPKCDQELPLCKGVACGDNAQCVVRNGMAKCDCVPNYKKIGTICQVQDPCASSPCSSSAVCKTLRQGKYECTCKDGYQGDGKICQPINPCVDNNGGCPENSTICNYKGPGKSSCMCKPGMTGLNPSAGCSPANECLQYYCNSPAKCEVSPDGTVGCVCKDGEIGDGRSCYRNLMSEITLLNTRGRWFRKLNGANKMFASGCSLALTKSGPYTVFVPNLQPYYEKSYFNDTIAQHLCKMHIIPGQHLMEDMMKTKILWTLSGHQLTFSGRVFRYQDQPAEVYSIIQSDIPASNGIIHIVNTVKKTLSFHNLGNPQKNIAEIIASMESFSRFETILENCGLPSILDGPGPFTVFVPSNDAVDKLRDGRLIYLFTKGINKLQELVKYHIYTAAAVTVEKLIMMPQILTMANQILIINITEDGRVLLGDSGVPLNKRDIVASNGIIHTLDGIFIPPLIIPILPHRCSEEQHKIIAGSCVDCGALNTSVCPPHSTEMVPDIFPSECVYVHDPLGLNVLRKGCARYCNQTIMKSGCCKGFFGPDCTPCPGGFSNPCYGRGNCSDGIQGNGNCICFEGFKGIACHICSNPNKHGEKCDEDCGCVHGICDNRPGSRGVCQSRSCQDGYIGEFCNRTSQNCGPTASQFCHRNAVCSLLGTARCICTDGYEGDGFSCLPIDLCRKPERGGCSENALCTPTGPGSATCQCNKGWTGDGKACIAVDNCVLETRGGCHINADCSFIGPGQSECTCKRGYAGDGYNCDLINPCKLDNGGCHDLAVCEPLGGGEWSCACSPGYKGDGFICYGNVLQELARNSHFAGFYEWIKKSFFSIPMGVHVTALVPSEAAIKSLSQAGKDFWLKPYTLPFLVRAHFLQGSFTAEQLKKYNGEELPTLNPRTRWEINNSSGAITIQNAVVVVADIPAINGTIYILNKVLLPPLGDIPPSRPGLQQQLEMVPSFSSFKGLLLQYQLIRIIESSEKYTIFVPGNNSVGEYCQASNITQLDNDTVQYHVVLGEKLSSADLKSGVHKSTMLGFSYWLMFYKNNNQTFVNNVRLDGKFFETKNGMLIGVSEVLPIQRNRCTANTTVIQKSRCTKCDKGIKCPYGSVLADTPGEGKKPHCVLKSGVSEIVGCYFTCVKVSLVSICCPGYYGHMCELCPGKPGSPCSGNGVCQDGITGSGECRCREGFHGTACEMCEVGRYGEDCKSVCACRSGICNDGLLGNGSCECFQGWEGITCDRSIGVDLCNKTCHQMANCINGSVDSLPTCACSAGYTGNGTYCSEIDPCAVDNGGCSTYATCSKVSAGERTCSCKEGYAGDGTLCQEIDGCLEKNGGCHANAECTKIGPNLVACNCLPGYSGNGTTQCDPINMCNENNGGCSKFGFCKYTGPGTRNCSCGWNYVGDGFVCRGTVYQELMRNEATSVFFKQLRTFGISELSGDGPFTVFVPRVDSIQYDATFAEWANEILIKDLLRYHLVSCKKLLASDLEMHKSITSLSGHKIRIVVKENSVHLNEDTRIITSDIVGVNGVIHIIDKILIPADLQNRNISFQLAKENITEVAEAYGYKIYSKLLREAELLPLVNNPAHRPFTMLWPTDTVFNTLPEKMQTWLYREDHRDKLAAYLKMHMIRDVKIVAGNLPHIASVRTMHGSTISFRCSSSSVGELLVDNGNAQIVQRHMEFDGGIAYGIDQLLEPPNLGARCDEFPSVELRGKSQTCFYYENPFSSFPSFSRRNYLLSRFPWNPLVVEEGSRWPSRRRTPRRGCRRTCFSTSWVPQCCANHYGKDCQVCPGGLAAPCSNQGTCADRIDGSGRCNCTEAFMGTACELCAPRRYGPACQACDCTEKGMCNEGLHGDGVCFCTEGWTGERCETKLVASPVCSPACHPNATCRAENICECNFHYEGDGRTCTVIDQCGDANGGCSDYANCTQVGIQRSCTCLQDYQGDGYVCSPIDRCADGRNGDCSEHALCISTAPNARKCECKAGYVGNGVQCLEEAVPPVDRCLEENGDCHPEAICTDLHFHDKTAGVFHLQSPQGRYNFTYGEAEAACMGEDASLATVQQLSAAQQMGFHLCSVGWLHNGTAGYPTVYPTPSCGSSHVGIVDYGARKNLSERWDAFCYRAKDVRCTCRDGFLGDGYSCSGNLVDVLAQHSNFSTFYSMLLDYTNATQDGLEFLTFLSNDTYKTLFVPLNAGFGSNMTLTWEELKLHISLSDVLLLSFNLTNGTVIPSCSGYNLLVAETPLLNSTQPPGSKLVNDTLIVQWDILAFNGIIHAIEGPLRMPQQPAQLDQVTGAMKSASPVSIGITSAVAIVLLLGVGAGVAYYYQKIKPQGFQFSYFKADLDEEELSSEQVKIPPSVSFPNPIFGAQSSMYEPFEDSFSGEDFSDSHRILE